MAKDARHPKAATLIVIICVSVYAFAYSELAKAGASVAASAVMAVLLSFWLLQGPRVAPLIPIRSTQLFDRNPGLFLIVAGVLLGGTVEVSLIAGHLSAFLEPYALKVAVDKIWKYVLSLIAIGACIQIGWNRLKKLDLTVEVEPILERKRPSACRRSPGRKHIIFVLSTVGGSLMLATSLVSYMFLPAYDPVNLFDDFTGHTVDSRLWVFVGALSGSKAPPGTFHVEDSVITLISHVGGVSFLNHSFVTYWPSGVKYGAWKGYIEFSVRFNGFSAGSNSIKIARTDGGWLGIAAHQFVYHDEASYGSSIYVLQPRIDNDWHTFRICFRDDGRWIHWDGALALRISTVTRFTHVSLGHTDPDWGSGGALSFDWFRSSATRGP